MKYIRYTKALAVALILALCLSACGKGNQSVSDPMLTTTATESTSAVSIETEPAQTSLTIMEDGKSTYQIVRAEEAPDSIKNGAVALVNAIKERTGVTVMPASDWYNPRGETPTFDAPEILIGETNRPETAEVKASLPAHGYAITAVNNKLVILGTDNSMTALALYAFEERILDNAERCGAGKLIFDASDAVTVTMDSALSVADMVASGHPITTASTKRVQTTVYREYNVGQGACSDGTYAYFVLRNSGDTGSVVVKHRLDDGSFVAVSEPLKLGHGNDMTFDTKNNRLVIAHGQSEGKILTLVDPETLTLIRDIDIPKGSGAITYSVAKDRYAISQGGSTLHILDGDFKWIVSYSRTDKTGYTAQGMGSDEDYIYFPMSGSSDNVLVVYDWEGNYITTITVPVNHESESMFWVNGRYYVAYNHGGEALYELAFTICYE